jgi:hypothetical protein
MKLVEGQTCNAWRKFSTRAAPIAPAPGYPQITARDKRLSLEKS